MQAGHTASGGGGGSGGSGGGAFAAAGAFAPGTAPAGFGLASGVAGDDGEPGWIGSAMDNSLGWQTADGFGTPPEPGQG